MTQPVQLLYHGTSLDYSEYIEEQGLTPQAYDKVYLTTDINVAYDYAMKRVHSIGSNTFQPVICVVNARKMYRDGFTFEHNVSTAEYTTTRVPPEYIIQVAIESEDELEHFTDYVQNSIRA